tara:strand:+ start:155 stop:658 length:504 start_codon:yes stop_codon:yes gene_type:complete
MITTKYDSLILKATALYLPEYDWRLFKAQLAAESGKELDANAVSPVGAEGIAQFMLPTWGDWAHKAGFKGFSRTDPRASIFTGAMYMQWLCGQWSSPREQIDRYLLAAASYNSGLGDILTAQKFARGVYPFAQIMHSLPDADPRGAEETANYCERILRYYSELITDV